MRVWREDVQLRELLDADPEVRALLSDEMLDACFDLSAGVRHVDMIFERLGLGA